jgi:hypothetical protein
VKQKPDVLEHGTIDALVLTTAQVKEQLEYDKAAQAALRALGYR